MGTADTRLSRWLHRQYGPGHHFKSARALALAAGLNENEVGRILEKGHSTADTLARIAKALDCPVTRIFVEAGLIPDDEVNFSLTEEEESLLKAFRHLTDPSSRRAVFVVAQALREQGESRAES